VADGEGKVISLNQQRRTATILLDNSRTVVASWEDVIEKDDNLGAAEAGEAAEGKEKEGAPAEKNVERRPAGSGSEGRRERTSRPRRERSSRPRGERENGREPREHADNDGNREGRGGRSNDRNHRSRRRPQDNREGQGSRPRRPRAPREKKEGSRDTKE
jgi:hypothetical protein